MPKSGEHRVNGIDSFFKVRPSNQNIREGESVSFLEDGKLVKQEKRNGVVYEQVFVEQNLTKKQQKQAAGDVTNLIISGSSTSGADLTGITAGTGLTGGGASGNITLNVVGGTGIDANADDISIDSTVTTLTGIQTLTNKTLTSPVINTSVSGTAILDEDNMSSDSNSKLATQQSIKAYVDSEISGIAAPANATITLSPGAGIGSIGDFTTNQSNNETLTIGVDGVLEDLDAMTAVSSANQFIVSTGAGAYHHENATNVIASLGLGDLALADEITDSQVASDASIAITKLAANSITIDGTSVSLGGSITTNTLSTEQVQDIVGAMLVGTETRINVDYDDTNNRIDFVVDDMTANTMGSGFVIEDGDSTEVIITENKEIKFVEGGGININFTNVANGTDADPFDLTFTLASHSADLLGSGTVPLGRLSGINDGNIASDAAIAISKLAENAITINGTSVPLGGSTTIATGSTPNNATITLSNGAGIGSIGNFTTNQSGDETLSIGVDGVLQDLDTLGAPSVNGQFIVATGSGAFQYETGSTVRTSLGLGDLAIKDGISDGDVDSDASIAITKLAESAITIDGTPVSLGGSITTNNTQLSTEQVQDIAGPLVATGGTKTGIAVTYDDINNNMDFVVASQTDNNFTTTLKNKLDDIEELADKTDAANVTAAGALMDTEVTDLDGIKTLTVPNNTTISTFGASLVDDANAAAAQTTLGLGNLAVLDTVGFDKISGSAIQTSTEINSSFGDNDTSLLTAAAVNDRIQSLITAANYTWTLSADSGSDTTVTDENIVDIAGGTGISTAVSLDAGRDTVTVNLDASINDLSDVIITNPQNNQVLQYSAQAGGFINLASSAITMSGATNNGLLTFNSSTEATVESELTYTAGTLKLERATGNAIFRIQSNDSNPRIYFNEGNTTKANLGYSISNNRFELFADGNTPFSIEDGAGSNTLVVDSNSRVGIGTGSPSYLLHLSGTAPELAFTDTDGSATWRTRAVANNFHITETGAGDPFVIQSGAGGNAITVMSSGNVSIGGATASRDLQVNGDGIIRVLNDSGDAGIDFNASDMQLRYRSASDKLQVYSYGNSANVMTIQKSNGFVGIGTESPTSLLTTSGGDIRILGSGNRLRFNTNGSIYWDSSAGIKLENGSSENITIETNTSGDIKFNTANTGTMVLTDDKEVFVGSNVQNQSLVLGGTLKTHQYLDTRDYMQHKGHFAESDWIVMESGQDHVVTSYFDNTNVYVDGVFKAKIDSAFGQATISASDLSLGSVISADRAVVVNQSGTIRAMCMNERFSGRILGSANTRGQPLVINIYAPYTSVSYEIFIGTSANTDITGTPETSGTISQGGIVTYTETGTTSQTQYYVIVADGKVCATLDDGSNDHLLFTPLSMEVIASAFSRESKGGITNGLEGSTTISETQNVNAYYLKDTTGKYGLFATGTADGSGSEAEFAMPIEFCSDYYIYGSTDLSSYRLVCFQDTFVKVLDVSGNVLYTHDASGATKHSPIYAQNGASTGATNISTAGPFRFVGTAPFYLVCQEGGGQDEATMLGAMQHELSNNQRFKGGYVPNATTIDANLVVNDSNFTLFADSANNKVGIGTSSPASPLHVNQDSNAEAFRVSGGGGGNKIASFIRDEGVSSPHAEVYIHAGSGDPQITFRDVGNEYFSIGLDDSANSFKISDNTSVGTNDRLTIDSSGNVGIGVTPSGGKLHVNGNLRVIGKVLGVFNTGFVSTDSVGNQATLMRQTSGDIMLIGDTNHTEQIKIQSANSTGNGYIHCQSDGNIGFSGNTSFSSPMTVNFGAVFNEGGNDSDTRIEGSSDANLVRVDASANRVGIGTGSPAYKLDVNGTSGLRDDVTIFDDKVLYVGNDLTNGLRIFHLSANNGNFIRSNGGALSILTVASQPIHFSTNNTNAMTIDSSQRVGIGTSSPSVKLHVNDNDVLIGNNSNGYATLNFHNEGTGSGRYGSIMKNYDSPFDMRIRASNSTAEMPLVFDGSNDTEYARFDTSGRFGIGTSSPGAKLDVDVAGSNGGIRVISSSDSKIAHFRLAGGSRELLQIGGESDSVSKVQIGTSATSAPAIEIDSLDDVKITESLGIGVAASSTTGRLDCSNDVVAFSTSDKRLKENIKPLDNALDKVLKISGVEFDWKELTEEEKETIHGNQGHDVGVIAQEIEEVLPEVVTTRDSGYKAVKYEKIVPLLIQAIKEQQQQINELKEKLNG